MSRIKEDFPKAWMKVLEILDLGCKVMPDEPEDYFLHKIIEDNPRILYDIFDSIGIYISVHSHPDSDNNMFVYYNSVKNVSFSAENRVQAEEAAFKDAFKILEEQINNAK
jgi:hypothetical protein